MAPSTLLKLRQKSPAGLQMFESMLQLLTGLGLSEHLNASLPGGNNLTIRVLPENNSEVAATLPGPAWQVREQ